MGRYLRLHIHKILGIWIPRTQPPFWAILSLLTSHKHLLSQLRCGGEVEGRRLGLLLLGLGLDLRICGLDVDDDVLDVLGVLPHVRSPRDLRLQTRVAELALEL